MNAKRLAKEVIRTLEEKGFYAECPCCGEPFLLSKAGLFHLDDFTPKAFELHQQLTTDIQERDAELRWERDRVSLSSETGARAVNIGLVLERLAPSMGTFRFDRNDCRSLFDPIDYVIFEGLSKNNHVDRIFFAEIKTGQARLNQRQKDIKNAIEAKRVEWDVYQGGPKS